MTKRTEKRLTPKQEQRAHVYALAGAIGGNYIMARRLVELESIGATLRKRFEATCSFPYANEDKFLARTSKLAERAKELAHYIGAAKCEINGNPRGPSIKLHMHSLDGLREFFL